MQKRKYIFIILGLTIILLTITYSYLKYHDYSLKYQIFLVSRHHLLCEVLKPGMSVDDVLGVLHQKGSFTMNKAEWSKGDIELGINFTDQDGKDSYGLFDLRFYHYKYAEAYVSNFDYKEIICNFYQPTRPSALQITPLP